MAKTPAIKNTPRCASCGEVLTYSGKGRPPRFCSLCKEANKGTKPASIAPVAGVPVTPPDVPQKTVLSGSAPKLMEVTGAPDPWGTVAAAAEAISSDDEVQNVERRITLLARYIMEATLWDAVGLSKKERFDAAVAAVKTLEGSKSNVWVKDPEKHKDLPATQKHFFKEKEEVSERLRRLLKEKDRIDDPQIKATAEQIVQIERGNVPEGEA